MGLMKNMFEKSNEASKELKEKRAEMKTNMTVNRSNKPYVITSVILKEKLVGVGSKNLSELEDVINAQCELGYKLHTCSIATLDSSGLAGGDRLQATLVFEKI